MVFGKDFLRVVFRYLAYSFGMPRRSPGQKLINVPVNEGFLRLINDAVGRGNYGDRAKLIREAIAEKLQTLGIKVAPELLTTPTRLGKAGRPPLKRMSK